MDYNALEEKTKNKMFDLYLCEIKSSPFQEQFRYFLCRDIWLKNTKRASEYYKKINKETRTDKILRINEKISNDK